MAEPRQSSANSRPSWAGRKSSRSSRGGGGVTLPSGALEIAFALVGPFAARVYALLVVTTLLGIVLLLLNSGRGRVLSSGTAVGLLRAAFLDVDTRTYSLSKLQFYVWAFAVIAGYIYLTIARSLVQGAFEFANVPDNLPLLLGIAVGTSVTSVGVASGLATKARAMSISRRPTS